jgi:HPr kinase/phosphorylase
MYGVGAVIDTKSVKMVVQLESWDDNKEYDRLGIEKEFYEILGIKIPKITIPVRPGRNIAIIVEVAARNYRLKAMGIDAAEDLIQRLMQ